MITDLIALLDSCSQSVFTGGGTKVTQHNEIMEQLLYMQPHAVHLSITNEAQTGSDTTQPARCKDADTQTRYDSLKQN